MLCLFMRYSFCHRAFGFTYSAWNIALSTFTPQSAAVSLRSAKVTVLSFYVANVRLSTVFHFRPRLCGFLCNVHLFHILRDFSYMYFFAYLLKSLNVICIVLHTIVLQSVLCFLPHSDCKSCIELKKDYTKKTFERKNWFFECTIYFSYEKRFVYNKKYISLT